MSTPNSRGKSFRNKWSIDFSSRSQRGAGLLDPVGYNSLESKSGKDPNKDKDANPQLLVKRSWDIALGPIKQVPMNIFIMWMAGNTISIFPIMMVGMMCFRPIQALLGYQPVFKMIEGGQAPLQKLVYILGNFVGIGLGLYKCHSMGLLPTYASDWLAFAEPPLRMEWSGGGIMF